MFCHKCGNELPEDSGFCTKCGAKLIADEAVLQTTAPPQHETITPVSTIAKNTQQAPSNNAGKVTGGLRNLEKIGRIIFGISLLLLFLCSIFRLPINPIIIVGGVAIGTILSALGLKRPLGMTKIIELVVACILLVAAIAYAVSSGGGGVGGGDKYVQMVKDGTLDGYPQKTVGKAFDEFLDNPKWESGLTENDERFVNVKGGIAYFDKEAELAIQFFVDEKNETFLYNACEINGAPQSNLIFWNLLETIYNDDSALAASRNNLDTASSDNRIVIGETQYYDNEFGNMEVTLDYVEFIDKIENPLIGGYNYPDEGSIFLRAEFTLKNMGTAKGSLITAWSAAVYDGMYEFKNLYTEGTLTDINPLTPPATGSIIFMLPNDVAESDKSLAININDGSGSAVISYAVRSAANMSGEDTSRITYFVELDESYSEGYEPAIMLYQDGRFSFLANMGEGVGFYNGTYHMNGGVYSFNVTETEFSGNKSSFEFAFAMRPIDDTLVFEGADSLGLTMKGAVFSLCDTPPKSIINAINDKGTYEGDGGYADNSATTTASDFVGTYSYDASFEDPTGKWNNFYYLLEIGLDGSALVVTQTWRGNYLFDHARVSPSDITGNTLVFDASVVGSTEPEIHSLTYLSAKDSPLGRDTIYIDDDETMPFVRE